MRNHGILVTILLYQLGHLVEGLNKTTIPRCQDLGTSKIICHEQCDAANNQCWQKTEIEKCSCHGYLSQLKEMATLDLTGRAKTAPGFGFIDECDQCHLRCQRAADNSSEDGEASHRRYVKDDRQSENCDHVQDKTVKIGPPRPAGANVKEKELDPLTTVDYGPPEVSGSCSDRGNLTRLCIEKCPRDGLSCTMEVKVDACTCGGRMLRMREVAKYDMETRERVFVATPYSNNGYTRVCGDCTEFCEYRQGETNEYYVNTYITTCFDHKKAVGR